MAEPSSSVDPSSPLSFSQFLERKEEAQGGPLSSHQIDLLDSFIAKVKALDTYKELKLPSEDLLARFLFAAKWNMDRAGERFERYHGKFGAREPFMIEDVLDLFQTQVLYMPGSRCRDNGELIVFNARLHDVDTSFFSYLDLFVYLADVAMQSRQTQQHGFTLIINMAQSTWKSFDLRLLNKFAAELQLHFPARLRHVYIVDAPVWTSLIVAGMKPFMTAKLAGKIHTVDRSTLHFYVAVENMPDELGGTLPVDFQQFVEKRKRAEAAEKVPGRRGGFLVLKGPAEKAWRRRWVVLHNNFLFVYRSTDEQFPLKVVDLQTCTSVAASSEDDKPFGFKVVLDNQALFFHAETEASLNQWLIALNGFIRQDLYRREQERLKVESEREREKLLLETLRREREEALEAKRLADSERKRRQEEEDRIRQEREDLLRQLHQKRTNIVQELIWTEQTYVETLRMITDVYIKPLRATIEINKPIVSDLQMKMLFPEIAAILNVNTALLADLEERFGAWSRTSLIGDIFLRMTESMRIYIGLVNNYNTAIETINKVQNEAAAFRSFLAECSKRPETRSIGLTEHLLTPIQRIPRYVMILDNLLKNTDSEHDDFENIKQALAQMRETADYINEMKRKADSRLRVVEVLDELKGVPNDFELIAPHRLFVSELEANELEVEQTPSNSSDDTWQNAKVLRSPAAKLRIRRVLRLYLFSDILLVAKMNGAKRADAPQAGPKRSGDIRYKTREKIQKVKVLAFPDVDTAANNWTGLMQVHVGERKFLLQAWSAKARDDFTASFEVINPLSKLIRSAGALSPQL